MILENEFVHYFHEYGPINMAFELKERNLISSMQYQILSNLSINDKHKSWLLIDFISEHSDSVDDLMDIFSNDRRLWHLSIRLSQRS